MFNETNDCPSSLEGTHNFINQALAEGKKHFPQMAEVLLAVPWEQDTECDRMWSTSSWKSHYTETKQPVNRNQKQPKRSYKENKRQSKTNLNWYSEKYGENINHAKQKNFGNK